MLIGPGENASWASTVLLATMLQTRSDPPGLPLGPSSDRRISIFVGAVDAHEEDRDVRKGCCLLVNLPEIDLN